MTKRIYVLAASYQHFRYWCRKNDVKPGSARYVAGPEMLMGIDARHIDFVYYETWIDHPRAQELDMLVRMAKRVAASYKEQAMESEYDNDNFWYRLTKLDPALYRGLIVATVTLLASIGVIVAPGIPDALIAFVAIIIPIIQALWTRSAVTANARVAVVVPDPVFAPDEVEPGEAVTTAPNSEIISAAKA